MFRYSLFQGSIVKRPFGAVNVVFSTVSILIYSAGILVSFVVLLKVLILATNLFYQYRFPIDFIDDAGKFFLIYDGVRYSLINFIFEFPEKAAFTFLAICIWALVLTEVVKLLAMRIPAIGRLMYGPLAPLLSQEHNGTGIFTCFVLTKIADGNKRIMYAGYPEEVSLKGASTIDHIVIREPIKFYLRLGRDRPLSTLATSQPVSTATSSSYIYLSGNEIENVHFEGFYLS